MKGTPILAIVELSSSTKAGGLNFRVQRKAAMFAYCKCPPQRRSFYPAAEPMAIANRSNKPMST
jgi:hypothetical protein